MILEEYRDWLFAYGIVSMYTADEDDDDHDDDDHDDNDVLWPLRWHLTVQYI